MSKKYILAVDEGTTGTRAALLNREGEIIAMFYREFTQYFPRAGWVEHDPEEIWQVTIQVVERVLSKAKVSAADIAAIGITNQRETTVLWEKDTGRPVYRAIVWQCRRTRPLCDELKADGLQETVKDKTGLIIDPYFSATKIKWILDNVPKVREGVKRGKILFGTVDSWLVWKLTGGKSHLTDYTNASRTMLFNIHSFEWDKELTDIFDVPEEILPQVRPSRDIYGYTEENEVLPRGIPIAGILGDQQAALFGQACFYPGTAKNTYGTGCFLLINTGEKAVNSSKGLLTSISCNEKGNPAYSLEGSIFVGGAAIQWLRDALGLIDAPEETEALARKVEDTGGVYVIPAFVGLGAPYWDPSARGAILGITRGTRKEHLVRATLESIAYQTKDILRVMLQEAGVSIRRIRVDGGAAKNDWLMQFQADILDLPVERPLYVETTSLGVGFLAGLGIGYWKEKEILHLWKREAVFLPQMRKETRERLYVGWQKAVARILTSSQKGT
ncbi:glycerol kinase GlpK [Candidatus Aerophobetes bacterium]|nr:glycerol kinase GlpK [Candidatus Aerophobetes bacterium]